MKITTAESRPNPNNGSLTQQTFTFNVLARANKVPVMALSKDSDREPSERSEKYPRYIMIRKNHETLYTLVRRNSVAFEAAVALSNGYLEMCIPCGVAPKGLLTFLGFFMQCGV